MSDPINADNLNGTDEATLKRRKLILEITRLTESQFAKPSVWFSAVSTGMALVSLGLVVFRNSAAEIEQRENIASVKLTVMMQNQNAVKNLAVLEAQIQDLTARLPVLNENAENFVQEVVDTNSEIEDLDEKISAVRAQLRIAFADAAYAKIKRDLDATSLPSQEASEFTVLRNSILDTIEKLRPQFFRLP
jgi:hypothetical protein